VDFTFSSPSFFLIQKICRRRQAIGLSQVELARQAGIRPETLNLIEQNKHSASVTTVDKLNHALSLAERKQDYTPPGFKSDISYQPEA
jgi:transcriptional regulator with XRE-family HTH domain